MNPYIVTFHLGLGIGVIRPCYCHISRYLGPYSHLWASIELRKEIGLIVHLFDIIYIRHPLDNSNQRNRMSDSGYSGIGLDYTLGMVIHLC